MTAEPRRPEGKQQSSKKQLEKTGSETQRKADGIQQEDDAERKMRNAICAHNLSTMVRSQTGGMVEKRVRPAERRGKSEERDG